MVARKKGDPPQHTFAATKKPDRDIAAAYALAAEQATGYQLIGQFISEFSQLDFSIRVLLANRLGLAKEYFDIVTAPYDFVMLCKVTQVLLCTQAPAKKKSIEKLFKDCITLNEDRVRVAHGMWTLGREGPTARHVSRSSLKPKFFFDQKNKLIWSPENGHHEDYYLDLVEDV
ncbi:MAG: hypothetical protein A3H32_07575 [Betaproteobacteria bacterium RIFCSPLOWO2_02_FULL_63_19]|nr:MAG: hypothetical protein A3H32_07575 [Betaproteobacteria bacterium RIFCSPLOWO2_02_FULL_63_19]